MKVALIGLMFVAVGAAACSKPVTVCAGLGLSLNEPSDTTIGVGQSFIARYYEGGYCVGDESSKRLELVPVISWHSPDSLIIFVDSATGRVTGRAVGNARLLSRDHGFIVPVRVR